MVVDRMIVAEFELVVFRRIEDHYDLHFCYT